MCSARRAQSEYNRNYTINYPLYKCGTQYQLLEQAKRRLKQSQKRDYYKILGVKRNAKKKDIKKVYRTLAAKAHPDNFHVSFIWVTTELWIFRMISEER